jgi:hypothetical protein
VILEIAGIALIIASFIAAVFAWFFKRKDEHLGRFLLLCMLTIAGGFGLTIHERVTEVTVGNIATIKTASKQALIDAEEIGNLKKRVENQSSTIDLIATEAKDAKNLHKEAKEKVREIDETIKGISSFRDKASDILEDLKEDQKFISLVNKSENYDTKAFFELVNLSNDRKNKFSPHAKMTVENIKDRLLKERVPGPAAIEYTISFSGEGKPDTGPFSIEEIYDHLSLGSNIRSMANVIRRQKLKTLVPNLVKFLDITQDLQTLNRITYSLSELTGHEWYPWNINEFEEWWYKHHSDFNEFPIHTAKSGMVQYRQRNFEGALENFKEVLKLDFDQSAHLSRAYAVICAVELNKLSLAKKILGEFKEEMLRARWYLLASARVLLAEGDRNAATRNLIRFSKKSHYFTKVVIRDKDDIWQKADWDLYDKEMKSPKSP